MNKNKYDPIVSQEIDKLDASDGDEKIISEYKIDRIFIDGKEAWTIQDDYGIISWSTTEGSACATVEQFKKRDKRIAELETELKKYIRMERARNYREYLTHDARRNG